MAYDFIGLVNDINRRLNEVELTSSNFATSGGFYSVAKDAVNSSIQHINQEEFEWPWNHADKTETLVAGTVRYAYPTDAKTLNLNTFRIKRNDSLNVGTTRVKNISYEEWLDNYGDVEYNSSTTVQGVPQFIARTPSRELVVYPAPDKAYELTYEYYQTVTPLDAATDTPSLPKQYRHVIVDGAMYYAYLFRGDTQNASMALSKFNQGLKNLRSIYINRTDYVRDRRVHF